MIPVQNVHLRCLACWMALLLPNPIPDMPKGKPGGGGRIQLTTDCRCRLFGRPERPFLTSLSQPQEMQHRAGARLKLS